MAENHRVEVAAGKRFRFGRNWARFLERINGQRILQARLSLCRTLGVETLAGKTFIDVGCGSGLFSLAARQLGAQVVSFDFDPESVACARKLKQAFFGADLNLDNAWQIREGSVLDRDFLAQFGKHDVVYSWGVLHHTGRMWQALDNLVPMVRPGGRLFIALYNDQGWVSHYWTLVKRLYNRSRLLALLAVIAHLSYPFMASVVVRALSGRLTAERGMSAWHDYLDWLGGYPFEVARPEEVFSFFRERGFVLIYLNTCGGRQGCNEFVFERPSLTDTDGVR